MAQSLSKAARAPAPSKLDVRRDEGKGVERTREALHPVIRLVLLSRRIPGLFCVLVYGEPLHRWRISLRLSGVSFTLGLRVLVIVHALAWFPLPANHARAVSPLLEEAPDAFVRDREEVLLGVSVSLYEVQSTRLGSKETARAAS